MRERDYEDVWGEGGLGGGVLSQAEGWAIVGALESVAVEVDDGLEARRVVWPLPDTCVGRQVEAAPMRNLLQELLLIHLSLSQLDLIGAELGLN